MQGGRIHQLGPLCRQTLHPCSRAPRVHADNGRALCCGKDKCLTLLQLLGILVMVSYGFCLGKCDYWKKMWKSQSAFIFLRVQLRPSKAHAHGWNVAPMRMLSAGQSDPEGWTRRLDPLLRNTHNISYVGFPLFNDVVKTVGPSASTTSLSPIINFYTNDANTDIENIMVST